MRSFRIFHPHLHLLMADGLFLRDERFLVLPENGMDAVEELFRARLITFLSKQGLLPPERAHMLKSWKHSGFNVHRSRRIQPDEREDLERVARYIIRNPFSTEKMEFTPPNAVNRDGTVIYRSGMNPKINRNFQIFTPCDFIAAITQHIPDKIFQLVRYYGWYSNSRPKGDGLPEVAATKRSGVATCGDSARNVPGRRKRPKRW